MKLNRLLPFALAGLALLAGGNLLATDVFREDFDNSPTYADARTLPTGLGVIHFGQWTEAGKKKHSGKVTHAKSLSAPASLELKLTGQNEDARAIGWFGKTNEATTAITEGLTIKIAFSAANHGTGFSIAVRNAEHAAAAIVELNETGGLAASFGGDRKEIAPIQVGEWYYVEFIFPANATKYTVNLYEKDGTTLLGSQKGRLARREGANGGLAYVIATQKTPDAPVYLDNISATLSQ